MARHIKFELDFIKALASLKEKEKQLVLLLRREQFTSDIGELIFNIP